MHNSSILLSLFSKCWKISKWTLSSCSCLHVQLALLDFQLQALANCDLFVLYKLRLHYSCGRLICSHCTGPLEGSFWLFLQCGSLQMGKYEVSTLSKQSENVTCSCSIHLPALLTYINYKWIRPDHTIKMSENFTWLVWCGGLRVENKIVMQEITEAFGPCLDQLKSQWCLTHLQRTERDLSC